MGVMGYGAQGSSAVELRDGTRVKLVGKEYCPVQKSGSAVVCQPEIFLLGWFKTVVPLMADELQESARVLRERVHQLIEIMDEDHGKAIHVFTIATVLFLPM